MIDIEIVGTTVRDVSNTFPVVLSTSNGWIVTIESDIRVPRSLSETGTLSAEDPKALEVLMRALTGRTIHAVDSSGGVLYLEFDESLEIAVNPDEDFEAWNIVGVQGERVVCMPGGELAYWSAR